MRPYFETPNRVAAKANLGTLATTLASLVLVMAEMGEQCAECTAQLLREALATNPQNLWEFPDYENGE